MTELCGCQTSFYMFIEDMCESHRQAWENEKWNLPIEDQLEIKKWWDQY